MTDPDQIARGIAHQFSGRDFQVMDEGRIRELLIDKIAAALREYGEARYTTGCIETFEKAEMEFKRGLAMHEEWSHNLLTDARRETQEADAEGFARGNEQGYRRGVEEGMRLCKEAYQRGQEGGK